MIFKSNRLRVNHIVTTHDDNDNNNNNDDGGDDVYAVSPQECPANSAMVGSGVKNIDDLQPIFIIMRAATNRYVVPGSDVQSVCHLTVSTLTIIQISSDRIIFLFSIQTTILSRTILPSLLSSIIPFIRVFDYKLMTYWTSIPVHLLIAPISLLTYTRKLRSSIAQYLNISQTQSYRKYNVLTAQVH